MTWGWLLKAVTNNDRIASSILEYPFLNLASAQKMPFSPADSCRRFSMRAFSPRLVIPVFQEFIFGAQKQKKKQDS